jgi:hypothetical protein
MASIIDGLAAHWTFDRGNLVDRIAGIALTNNNGVTFTRAGKTGDASNHVAGSSQNLIATTPQLDSATIAAVDECDTTFIAELPQ